MNGEERQPLSIILSMTVILTVILDGPTFSIAYGTNESSYVEHKLSQADIIPSMWTPIIQLSGFISVIVAILITTVKVTRHITQVEGKITNEATRLDGRIDLLEERIRAQHNNNNNNWTHNTLRPRPSDVVILGGCSDKLLHHYYHCPCRIWILRSSKQFNWYDNSTSIMARFQFNTRYVRYGRRVSTCWG